MIQMPRVYAKVGGIPLAQIAGTKTDLYAGGTAGGRTIVSGGVNYQIRQTGFIRQVVMQVDDSSTANVANALKIKVVRPNSTPITTSTTWTVVGEYLVPDVVPVGPALWTVNLVTPIYCKAGDYLAVWLSGSGSYRMALSTYKPPSDGITYWGDNQDLATGGTLASWSSGADGGAAVGQLGIVGYDMQPTFCVVGDSIIGGHGTGANIYYTYFDALNNRLTSGWGNPTIAEPAYDIQNILGSEWRYQNYAFGGSDHAWALATGIPAAIAANPLAIVFLCGANDIANGDTVASMLTELGQMRALIPSTMRFIHTDILPWNVSQGGSDANAALTRQYNAALPGFCALNNIEYIQCHDQFGMLRVSTGYLDDLATAYSDDGIHLALIGKLKLAGLIATQLSNPSIIITASTGNGTTGYGYTTQADGNTIEPNVTVLWSMIQTPSGDVGVIVDPIAKTSVSDNTGLVQFVNTRPGAVYQVSTIRSGVPVPICRFIAGFTATYQVKSLIC